MDTPCQKMQRWSYISAGIYIFLSVVQVPFINVISDFAFISFAFLRFSLFRTQVAAKQSERKRLVAICVGFVAAVATGILLSMILPMIRAYPFTHASFELARYLAAVYVAGALVYFVRHDQNNGALQPPQPTTDSSAISRG